MTIAKGGKAMYKIHRPPRTITHRATRLIVAFAVAVSSLAAVTTMRTAKPAAALPELTYQVHTVYNGRDVTTPPTSFLLPTFVDVDGFGWDHTVSISALPGGDLASILAGQANLILRLDISRVLLVPPMNALIEIIVTPEAGKPRRVAVGYDARRSGTPRAFTATATLADAFSRMTTVISTTEPGASLDLIGQTWTTNKFGGQDRIGGSLRMTPVPSTFIADIAQPIVPTADISKVSTLLTARLSTPVPVVLDGTLRMYGTFDKRDMTVHVDRLPASQPGVPSVALSLLGTGASGLDRRVEYAASGPIRDIWMSLSAVAGSPLAGPVRQAFAQIRDLPARFAVDIAGDSSRVSFESAGGAAVGSIDVTLTNGVAVTPLPAGTDGFTLTMRPGIFTVAARISGLRGFRFVRAEGCRAATAQTPRCTDATNVIVDTVTGRPFRAEVLTRSTKDEYVTGTLDSLPRHLDIRLEERKLVFVSPVGGTISPIPEQTVVSVVATPQTSGGLRVATNAGARELLDARANPVPTGARFCLNTQTNGCAGVSSGASFSVAVNPPVTVNVVDCTRLADCSVGSQAPWMRLTDVRIQRLDGQIIDSYIESTGYTTKGIFLDTLGLGLSGAVDISRGEGTAPVRLVLAPGTWISRRLLALVTSPGRVGIDDFGEMHCGPGTTTNLGFLVNFLINRVVCNV
jgi:hypothetical protein